MAANPVTVTTPEGEPVPAPFRGEQIVLQRPGVEFAIDGVYNTLSGKWSASGSLWLTTMRLVFVADKACPGPGPRAFEVPLSYITQDRFEKLESVHTRLGGRVWPVTADGKAGTYDPHNFMLNFKAGGVGTLLPLFHAFLDAARAQASAEGPQELAAEDMDAVDVVSVAPPTPQQMLFTAKCDPRDPSRLFMTQPVAEEDYLQQQPAYASGHGP